MADQQVITDHRPGVVAGEPPAAAIDPRVVHRAVAALLAMAPVAGVWLLLGGVPAILRGTTLLRVITH